MSSDRCQICNQENFKYTCPKCNILFCSVNCYKSQSHNRCSEVFYKNCVQEEMALQAARNSLADIPGLSEDIIRMYAILKRMESQDSSRSNRSSISDFDITDDIEIASEDEQEEIDSDDEKPAIDLSERLSGVDLEDSDKVWSKLTDAEKQDFKAIVHNGAVGQILPPFTPWWTYKIQKQLIEDVSEAHPAPKDDKLALICPKVMEKIPLFEKLTSKKPSPCLPNNLTNMLGAYTCAVRFFNGDHHSSSIEASKYFVMLCATLRKNTNFNDEDEAIKSILFEAQTESLHLPIEDEKLIRKDVKNILEGRHVGTNDSSYTLAALSDILRLFTAAKTPKQRVTEKQKEKNEKQFRKQFPDHEIITFEDLSNTRLVQLIKKVEFYLSFVDNRS